MAPSIFDKRIEDAQAAGFITQNTDGSFSPTTKAKIFTVVMIRLGKISNSLSNYESMKQSLNDD